MSKNTELFASLDERERIRVLSRKQELKEAYQKKQLLTYLTNLAIMEATAGNYEGFHLFLIESDLFKHQKNDTQATTVKDELFLEIALKIETQLMGKTVQGVSNRDIH